VRTNSLIINNSLIYNNIDGVAIEGRGNAINNSQIFNNNSYGLQLTKTDETMLNNIQIYNNSMYGVVFGPESFNTNINNLSVYNNEYGIGI
jgi:hypothetical protein